MKIDALFDTSVVIEILRSTPQEVTWYQELGKQRIVITPVVWMETVEGARDKIERTQILKFLRDFRIEHPTPDDNNWAMLQLARFHLSHGIEFDDIMIASVAVRLAVPLFTHNIKHYAPLPGVDERLPY